MLLCWFSHRWRLWVRGGRDRPLPPRLEWGEVFHGKLIAQSVDEETFLGKGQLLSDSE